MDYGMDQTAAAKDEEARTDKKDPAALNLVGANTKTTGPECPDRNQQTYKSNENLLTNMVIEQKLFRQNII
jgi:hypothetical protein